MVKWSLIQEGMTPDCLILEGQLVYIWSIRVDALFETLVGDWMSCLRSRALHMLDR